jgi:hypothetical protein
MKHQTLKEEQERYNPVSVIIEYNSDDYEKECLSGGSDKCVCDVCVDADESQFDRVMAVIGQRILNMKNAKTRTFITSAATLNNEHAQFKFKGREYQCPVNVGKDYFDAISYYLPEHVQFPLYEIQVLPGTVKDNGKDMQINLRGYDRKLVVLTIRQR